MHLLLALIMAATLTVTTDGQTLTVSNDGDTPTTAYVQIGDGDQTVTLEAGGNVTFGYTTFPHWAVWDADDVLVSYGVFEGGPEPITVEGLAEAAPQLNVAPTVTVFHGSTRFRPQ